MNYRQIDALTASIKYTIFQVSIYSIPKEKGIRAGIYIKYLPATINRFDLLSHRRNSLQSSRKLH